MKKPIVLEQRIKRVSILFKELEYNINDEQRTPEIYTCEIENKEGFQGTVFIDRSSKFVEVAYSFSFSFHLFDLIRNNLEEILKICYEFGCYNNFFKSKHEMTFSIFTKVYFSGLNYDSLKESLNDFIGCQKSIMKIIDFEIFQKASKGD